jgi:mono/diheme cytochrome c family protein
MRRNLILLTAALAVFFGAYSLVTLYDTFFRFGRMWETPAVKPHEQPLLVMDAGLVPVDGGEALYRSAEPASLVSPLDPRDPQALEAGARLYGYFCLPCHGRRHDGEGTVGQSFAPLPGDLRSARVQAQADSQMFREISYGRPGGRQPALATTIPPEDRWRIIHYIKSLGARP